MSIHLLHLSLKQQPYCLTLNPEVSVVTLSSLQSLSPAEINVIQISVGQRETCDYYQ